MPEYLSPGVFIEEIPARLKAIEGVSTSTGAFVGAAEKGPVPGFALPFAPGDFVLPLDPTPVLVTSFGEFQRTFGAPLPLPDANNNGFLARSVRAFFDNGGKRCYIARVVDPAVSTRSRVRVQQGVVAHFARRARTGDGTVASPLFFNSQRGIAVNSVLRFRRRSNGTTIQSGGVDYLPTVASYDSRQGTVVLNGPTFLPEDMEPGAVYVTLDGAAPTDTGPRFWARTPGGVSANLRIEITPSERARTAITAPAAIGATQIDVASTSSFYRGAIVELDHATQRTYVEVAEIVSATRLRLEGGGLTVAVTPAHFARVVELDLTLTDATGSLPIIETYKGLSWNPRNLPDVRARHYATAINTRSRLAYAQPPGVDDLAADSEDTTVDTQPTTADGFGVTPATAGAGLFTLGTPGLPTSDDHYVGVDGGPGARTGIQSLADAEDARIVAVPGRTSATVQTALIGHCERLRYRFAVLDGEEAIAGGSVSGVLIHRDIYDSSYAAYYSPWIEVVEADQKVYLPPSGYAAGIYARTDVERGVHKAPANEVVRGATGLRYYFTTGEQDILNPRGVNAIRRFEGRGIRVWGARTLSSDPEFRYINVRRFLIFLEASLDRGTQWVVFEPNTPDTWTRVVDSVSAFLNTQWRSGALFGRRAEDAFYVRCDESTMSADDVQNGRLICEIGVAIVRPAEFVIFRIEQITGFGKTA